MNSYARRLLADEYILIGRRLMAYTEMCIAGHQLLVLSQERNSEELFRQAETILKQMRAEIRERPLFEVVPPKNMN